MERAVVDWIGLVLIIGLIGSGIFMVHSMERGRSLLQVRFAAVVSIIFMVAFLVHALGGW